MIRLKNNVSRRLNGAMTRDREAEVIGIDKPLYYREDNIKARWWKKGCLYTIKGLEGVNIVRLRQESGW